MERTEPELVIDRDEDGNREESFESTLTVDYEEPRTGVLETGSLTYNASRKEDIPQIGDNVPIYVRYFGEKKQLVYRQAPVWYYVASGALALFFVGFLLLYLRPKYGGRQKQ